MKRTAWLLAMSWMMSAGVMGCEEEAATCTANSDCELEAVCGPNARCQAGGVGDPCVNESQCDLDLVCEDSRCDVSPCQGTARPCSLNATLFTCDLAPGCYDNGSCGGVAIPCSSFSSSFTCSNQPGCYWSSFDDACSGIVLSCSTRLLESSCEDTLGCLWNPSCVGDAWECDTLPADMCLDQGGCFLN